MALVVGSVRLSRVHVASWPELGRTIRFQSRVQSPQYGINFRGILTSGSLSKPLEIEGSLDDLKAFKEEVTAFGQELEVIGAITDSVSAPLILAHLDAMILKLTTLKQGNNTANQNALKKNMKQR